MDREQWLIARRSGVGGSDAAAACGLNPYVSPLDLYFDKTGEVVIEREDTERMQMGRALEDTIADVFAERFDVKLRRHAMRRHPRYPWMIGNPDRLIEGARIGLEIKNVDALAYRFGQWGEPDTDEIPEPYFLQCLHYAMIFDYREWHLAALVGGNTLKRYIVRRDAELEEMLIEGEREFWQCVEQHKAPEIDCSRPGALALIKRVYGTNEGAIVLPESVEHWHRVRMEADELAKHYERSADEAKAHILRTMEGAAIGRLASGDGEYRQKIVRRPGHTVSPSEYVDFRFSKKGAKNE
ncbi:Putative phage-type endonuclease [Paraburkholderia unamae]|uniref:YqaJ viral recombinase family nuclease n=1 Tax=Paraburkholderia unamae TaxID=219649 RepID=UPI001CB2EA58|nr:YqaJ viral recombinase family protein [Paraburkholderia unamae]CAG9258518.1 Putative phage-type endonuclease [Paraburkholderia unamae]